MVNENSSQDPILSQFNPVHALTFCSSPSPPFSSDQQTEIERKHLASLMSATCRSISYFLISSRTEHLLNCKEAKLNNFVSR
jgi:hypothetical protein